MADAREERSLEGDQNEAENMYVSMMESVGIDIIDEMETLDETEPEPEDRTESQNDPDIQGVAPVSEEKISNEKEEEEESMLERGSFDIIDEMETVDETEPEPEDNTESQNDPGTCEEDAPLDEEKTSDETISEENKDELLQEEEVKERLITHSLGNLLSSFNRTGNSGAQKMETLQGQHCSDRSLNKNDNTDADGVNDGICEGAAGVSKPVGQKRLREEEEHEEDQATKSTKMDDSSLEATAFDSKNVVSMKEEHSWIKDKNKSIADEYGSYIKFTLSGYFLCEVCLSEMNGRPSLELHVSGMKHLKKVAVYEKNKELICSNDGRNLAVQQMQEQKNIEDVEVKDNKTNTSNRTKRDGGRTRDGEREKKQYRDGDRGRNRQRKRGQYRDAEREIGQYRDAKREIGRYSDGDRSRVGERERGQYRDRERDAGRNTSRERDRYGSKDRDRYRYGSRDRYKDVGREGDRYRDASRERDGYRNRSRDRDRDQYRDMTRGGDRYRGESRDRDGYRDRYRGGSGSRNGYRDRDSSRDRHLTYTDSSEPPYDRARYNDGGFDYRDQAQRRDDSPYKRDTPMHQKNANLPYNHRDSLYSRREELPYQAGESSSYQRRESSYQRRDDSLYLGGETSYQNRGKLDDTVGILQGNFRRQEKMYAAPVSTGVDYGTALTYTSPQTSQGAILQGAVGNWLMHLASCSMKNEEDVDLGLKIISLFLKPLKEYSCRLKDASSSDVCESDCCNRSELEIPERV
ncbi:uncharacterized protein DDB_G0284459-like isoform X2 [Penaeus japonicus]|uniref:uncharacterized protein DDB_G0284459-like isoform X2 n=1 Tax=Penaeus japonicus TaxID=27405 RepID=UPI001C710176|nr:uncharacterized protein DDB_G0284459-like isoform X2 [Penaeus japonicus]